MSIGLIERYNDEDQPTKKLELDTFRKYSNIMLKIINLQNIDEKTDKMPPWLDMLIQCSKTSFIKICLVSVEVFLEIVSFDQNDKEAIGASVFINIQRLIADAAGSSGKFTEKFTKSPDFKKNFLRMLMHQNTEEQEDTSVKNGHTHCKEII